MSRRPGGENDGMLPVKVTVAVGRKTLPLERVSDLRIVRALEETRDTAELPEASGEAIAREFERYLKRRDSGND